MMKTLKFLIIPIVAWSLSGCSSSDTAACSSAANVNNPECQKQINDVDDRPLTLAVTFVDSNYYDRNSKTWTDVKKENLEGGVFGPSVSIYSDFLNISSRSAMTSILLSMDQKANPQKYIENEYNRIPYIEVANEEGVDYIFSYTKMDLNQQIVYEKQGKLIVQDNRAILPLINETFDGKFFDNISIAAGSNFQHYITIAAQSKDKRGVRSTKINFEAVLQIPQTDFTVKIAQQTVDFNLKNRWKAYFNGSDNAQNDDFPFMTLVENKAVSEQVPLDLQISMKALKMEVVQNVFFEMPFNTEEIKNTGRVNPQRGYKFFVRPQTLSALNRLPNETSNSDIGMHMRINGNPFKLVSGATKISLPAGAAWNIGMSFSFLSSGIISPLRPVCYQDSNTPFSPIAISNAKTTASASGGYYSVCHPQANREVIITPQEVDSPPFALTDTWYDYFSYVPYDIFNREVGHFYGIRDVTLRMSGCLKVETSEPGLNNWTTKTASHALCDAAGGGPTQGWVYFYAEKKATIFEDVNNYQGISGLSPLIQAFGSRPVDTSLQQYFFNGQDLNPTKKLY